MARFASWLMVLFLAAVGVGCATFATPAPTPARQLSRAELEQPPPPPNERYYALVFGAQRVPYLRPDLTHTWATVVRVVSPVDGCGPPHLDVQTISWLPATLKIRLFHFEVETPINLGLHETIAWAYGTGQSVAMWGPYELRTSVYRRFLIQKAFLESGAIGYQCIDTVGEARNGSGADCIHAISDFDPHYNRARYPLTFYGKPASMRLVREAARRQAFIDPDTTHDWLIPALGLDQYPLERRDQPYKGIRPPLDPDAGRRQWVR